jgi:hypothetical protein
MWVTVISILLQRIPDHSNRRRNTMSMATPMVVRVCTLMLCLGLMLVSGCGSFLKPELGAVARKEARIALAGDIPAGIWETGDLRCTYSFTEKGGIDNLTGKMVFDRSLTDSFPILTTFFFYLSYLDDAGKVIETVDITPVIHAFGAVPDSLPLNVSHRRPSASRAIAFHYFGGFRENSSHHGGGGQWEIHHFPFN